MFKNAQPHRGSIKSTRTRGKMKIEGIERRRGSFMTKRTIISTELKLRPTKQNAVTYTYSFKESTKKF